MANPPVNRRPGVDADIFQGTWVRGYDVPAGDQTLPAPDPCDLIISNGKSQIDQSVSNLIFSNRKDDLNQPIFVMAQGDTPTAPIGTVNFHIGRDADPNGLITTSTSGSLYASYGSPSLWQLQDDNITWVAISDELGGENLNETLAIGDFTGGQNIRITNGDFIIGVNSTTGVGGATVDIRGGNELTAAGNGGLVNIQGGTSVGGTTGAIALSTPGSTGTAGTGSISLITGGSFQGAGSGGIQFTTGAAGAPGIFGNAGDFRYDGGKSLGGNVGIGGQFFVFPGDAETDGQGGNIYMQAGTAGSGFLFPPLPIAGKGGAVIIAAGNSAGTTSGAQVTLAAGAGGSGGASGGNLNLIPGNGGGGGVDGIIKGFGNIETDNIKRGSGNPNGSVNGNEGDIYQRTDSGTGELWLNLNGTITGWSKMALSGDFISSFEQMNWGYLSRTGANQGGGDDENFSATGNFEGLDFIDNGTGGVITGSGRNRSGPYVTLSAPGAGDIAGFDMVTNSTTGLPYSLDQDFVVTFRVRNADVSSQRIFFGISQEDVVAHANDDTPPGGKFVGFVASSASDWRVVSGNGLGTTNEGTGLNVVSTQAVTVSHFFFVIDAIDAVSGSGPVRFLIFDHNLNLLVSKELVSTIPPTSDAMGLVVVQRNIANAGSTDLNITSVSYVPDAGVVAQGGGLGVGALALNQVLINGNESGANPILMNHNSGGIRGVEDDNAGAGGDLVLESGGTTNVGQPTGNMMITTENGLAASTAQTGNTSVFTGAQTGAGSSGDSGQLLLGTGAVIGSGASGKVTLSTGFHGGAGGPVGDIEILAGLLSAGGMTSGGNILVRAAGTSISGVTTGAVTIQSGNSTGATGDTGDVNLTSADANLDGASGDMTLETGNAGTNAGTSGQLDIGTGNAVAGSTGAISISTGAAGNGTAGTIFMVTGNTTVGNGTDISVTAGTTTDFLGNGGNINLTPGTNGGGGTDGAVIINGKLTVTGPIDPTALGFTGVAANPLVIGGGIDGILWVDNTGPNGQLIYTNAAGDNNITTGGGATTLSSLTDVTIAAPAPGEILMLNGALQWVNAAGAGGSPLATILAIGNTTGALPIVVEDTLGSRITSDGNLVLDPAVAPGSAVVIDGLTWPEADGVAGYVLSTNGLGQLSFQPGGGGGGAGFAETFAQMQWGAIQAGGAPLVQGDGIFQTLLSGATSGGSTAGPSIEGPNGAVLPMTTGGGAGDQVVVQAISRGLRLDTLPLAVFKFNGAIPDGDVRHFVGLTTSTGAPAFSTQVASLAPPDQHIGIRLYADAPETTLQFVTSTGGAPTTVNTTVLPATAQGYYLTIDGTTAGQATLTLYDNNFTAVPGAVHTFVSGPDPVPVPTVELLPYNGAQAILGGAPGTFGMYSMTGVVRADLLQAIGGGGGNQNLTSVLGFGAGTGGIPIQGDDNAGGSGSSLDLLGGSSTGGGGNGGNVQILAGAPDPAGIGNAGDVQISTETGAGTGDGGDFQIALGVGGPAGGDGGSFVLAAGNGTLTGGGGGLTVVAGDGGTGLGSAPGAIGFTTGSGGVGSGATGARFQVVTGDGDGTGNGGGVLYTTGAGGAGGGNGGSFVLNLGVGNGGGTDGILIVTGDAHITGKLTVDGMIDPPGLLMSSSGIAPFTPVGSEGGIWVNAAGELIFTNLGGDLNLSTAIGGGLGFLDALLISGYGFMAPGNPIGGPQNYGVYGSSSNFHVTPPGAITFSTDSDGPALTLSLGAAPGAQAYNSTLDLTISRDQQFKAVFKFQSTSPANIDERIFIGFTDDASATTPTVQLGSNHPVGGLQYMGLAQSLAGFNLEFVAQGSGGAMGAVFAVPTDALIHYLQIDASDPAGSVTFNLYKADGVTLEATHTQPNAGMFLPDLSLPTRPFIGIASAASITPRTLDFYFSSVMTRADVVDSVVGGGGGGGTPVLSAVLGAGNTTGGTAILVDSSIDGDGVDLLLNGGMPGAGGPSTVRAGASSGDDGGSFTALGGGGAGAAGIGGGAVLTAGDGSGTGAGGDISATAGNGGATGDAGNLRLAAGTPGAGGTFGTALVLGDTTAPVPPALVGLEDGAVVLVGATSAGASGGSIGTLRGESTGAGRGGQSFILGGDAAAASNAIGGGLTLLGGVGDGTGRGGNITLTTGVGGASGSGGDMSFLGASALGGSSGDGGSFFVTAGAEDPGGAAGQIHILSAGAVAFATPAVKGDIQLIARTEPAASGGAYVVLGSGSGVLGGIGTLGGGNAVVGSGAIGGAVAMFAGNGDTAAAGGFAQVRAGDGGATGDGGDVRLRAGDATGGAATAGHVRLTPGTNGAGTDGVVTFEGKIDPAPTSPIPGLQYSYGGSMGSQGAPDPGMIDPTLLFAGASGPTSFVVPFNAAFPVPPESIQVTMGVLGGGPLGVAPPVITYVIDVVTPAGFQIVFSVFPAGFGFYWKAML